jgi:hypothetical protein
MYGWIIALSTNQNDLAAGNQCFISFFSTVTLLDYWIIDASQILTTGNYFNVIFYGPVKFFKNGLSSYE